MATAIKHQLRTLLGQMIQAAFGHDCRMYYHDLFLPSMM